MPEHGVGLPLGDKVGFEFVGLGLLFDRGIAGGFEGNDALLAAQLGFRLDHVCIGAGFKLGITCRAARRHRIGLGLIGVGFGLVGLGALTHRGVARHFEFAARFLFRQFAFGLFPKLGVVGGGFGFDPLLRI